MAETGGGSAAAALRIVREMHGDASRLFLDLDGWMGGRQYVRFGDDQVTRGISVDVKRGLFMADGLYRRWVYQIDRTSDATRAFMVNVVFFDQDMGLVEPILIAAKVLLRKPLAQGEHHWLPWSAYSDLGVERQLDKAFELGSTIERDPIESGSLIAQPLFVITGRQEAFRLLERLDEEHSSTSV